ncbi:uncharacterized protein Z519_12219 [Cladophialophora bantiana CBS 173.52]|uniref:3-hydroxyacyl-CoA dehydrogenase n=1 Tax=Cladophialophora bantiana (strain ATCC 10958 / CBS 173.52 / CDC B-1940 / NIH 8579) TaxID=1442370 RepID=A0A0D2H1I3_CLAB1|nr:uncharacterized protein Z519_12219 [Cladophialophora bantiana CBS 173.52]KIW87108.1 hypothetical protein Z519_12219 [Cladophialophora bantiana CBS 173.52]
MSQYPNFPDRNTFLNLKGKVVVVTGGASGIGAALVTILHHHGAYTVFGDINRAAGEVLVKTLLPNSQSQSTDTSSANGSDGVLTFLPCDVCNYSDIYALFRTAHDEHGRVDHAVFCAGIVDSPTSSYFDAALTIDSVGKEHGDTRTLDVNFFATCAFARIALPFLRRGPEGEARLPNRATATGSSDRSLTFLSSVTGFRDAPGMFLYQTSKQAILGLMRAMRTVIFGRDGIRINAVCPGMTESPMTSAIGLIDLFKYREFKSSAQLPSHYQSSEAVAEHIASVMLAEGLNGKSIYVEEGKGWDFEDGLAREMPRWLGEEPTRWSDENLRFLGSFGGL